MSESQVVASLHSSNHHRLWKAAVKWPMYTVALMPMLIVVGWLNSQRMTIRFGQMIGFLIAAVLLLAWENLANDVFDADTGVDTSGKPHSLVNITGSRSAIALLSNGFLILGLSIFGIIAYQSSLQVLWLVLACCGLGYFYQGPPFRLGYRGLGEPLCWLAFGPLATSAALMALIPVSELEKIPWYSSLELGSGPALATTLVLFCSHFHQVEEDYIHGKYSPVVRLGTNRASALIPWFISLTLAFEWWPILTGIWPLTGFLSALGLPAGINLIRLLQNHHGNPKLIANSKFLALRFQALNGLGLALGLSISPFFEVRY
uniref:1,4-dihydroxy-2-naphthoate octaprenyltransferase n=1 Tax=Paulinella longichromatophora TaxID=1708747 RepID=A0A2H4ZPB0_9EUKA|nr:1,4-dihydroxy-2-naphthoate octaprenyltransferase [Paulinella longichromatophora]